MKIEAVDKFCINMLKDLNARLTKIEDAIVQKAVALDKVLAAELAINKDSMCDYELDLEVSFYNDFLEDPLLELNRSGIGRLKDISSRGNYSSLADGQNHNEFASMTNHVFYGEFHCSLFHALYNSYLDLYEILSISKIFWDIIPKYQYCEVVTPLSSKTTVTNHSKLPIVYDQDTYRFYLPDVVKEAMNTNHYAIDLRKFERIAGIISLSYRLQKRVITPILDEELAACHTLEYLLKVRSDKTTISTILNLDILNYIPTPMSNEYLIDPIRAMVRGTIEASFLALQYGWAINIGGGFHHAHKNKGGGFCFFNDYALATLNLREKYPHLRILYIDLDAHLGDGVIEFALNIENFYIIDVYNTFKENLHTIKRSHDNRFTLVGIPLYTSDNAYFSYLNQYLLPEIDNLAPDFIFYNGGGDILAGDTLGKLSVSPEGLEQRDLLIFQEAKKRHIPITMCLSGGYGKHNYQSVLKSLEAVIHVMTETKEG